MTRTSPEATPASTRFLTFTNPQTYDTVIWNDGTGPGRAQVFPVQPSFIASPKPDYQFSIDLAKSCTNGNPFRKLWERAGCRDCVANQLIGRGNIPGMPSAISDLEVTNVYEEGRGYAVGASCTILFLILNSPLLEKQLQIKGQKCKLRGYKPPCLSQSEFVEKVRIR